MKTLIIAMGRRRGPIRVRTLNTSHKNPAQTDAEATSVIASVARRSCDVSSGATTNPLCASRRKAHPP
ncbi:MAG: hypothetical protein KDJ12_11110, partial [Hyphomicrobiales bacterium]|nr:hypothetical protein [Hyphomicrobiales bacterium]